MKTVAATILGLALAISPLLAQEPPTDKDKDKSKQQEPRKPEPQPQDDKAKPKEGPTKEQKAQKDQKEQKEQEKNNEKQQKNDKQAKKQPAENSTAAASNGKRIPPQKYQASFGNSHRFKVHQLVEGRRFQYSGYWFELVEVWPTGWSYGDDCYIAQDGDDYYLYDVNYPTVRVLVVVVDA